jgi:hypothetical protein
VEAASEWQRLSAHLDKMIGSAEIASYTRVDLSDLVFPLVPQPTIEPNSRSVSVPIFEQQSFSDSFELFHERITSDAILYVTTTLLPGLAITDALLPIRLSEDTSIERLDADDVRTLGYRGLIRPSLNPILIEHPDQQWLALRVSQSFPKVIVEDPDPSADAIMKWVNVLEDIHLSTLYALALTKYGTVVLGGQMTAAIGWDVLGTRLQPSKADYADLQRDSTRVIKLEATDCETFRQLFLVLRGSARGTMPLASQCDALRGAWRTRETKIGCLTL